MKLPNPPSAVEALSFVDMRAAVSPGPLLCTVPHAGRDYKPAFLQTVAVDLFSLRRMEDSYVDELLGHAVQCGSELWIVTLPRAVLDLNREPYEWDPRLIEGELPAHANSQSWRVSCGLGTLPRKLGDGRDIHRAKLALDHAHSMTMDYHIPYHQALACSLAAKRHLYGASFLLDWHSMPSRHGERRLKADIVLGDRHGQSCAASLVAEAERLFRRLGLSVALNAPFAGGYITERHGQPRAHQHALQIEIRRDLYLNEATLELLPEAVSLRGVIDTVLLGLQDVVSVLAQKGLSQSERSLAAE